MARKVLVRLVDDLDGLPGEDVATVTFALDGVSYEIDLREENADRLRGDLADYVAAARRTGGRAKRGTASVTPAGRSGQASAIREWARKQGHDLAERGRIPAHIIDEFHAAQRGVVAKVIARAKAPASRAKTAAVAKSTGVKATASTAKARTTKSAGTAKAAKPAAKGRTEAKTAGRSRRAAGKARP
jgi:hypothetical protein